ncbi:MAG: transcriptional regulator, partial [Pseudophaeobacter sp.]
RIFELESFAHASGYYAGLPLEIRLQQLEQFERLTTQLYPRLRIYLFDAKRLFSSPLTIFGPLLCVFYGGSHYMAFRDRARIETFTGHFDRLVREADITARQVSGRLRALRAAISG